MTAAGPTTSIREEPYQGEIIKRYGVRAVIGKGGMGAKTLAALKEHGAVYLNAIGGAAQFYARTITGGGRRVAARVRHAGSDVAPDASRTSRRSSRWTRTATACTRTSSRSRASTSRRSAVSLDVVWREILERRPRGSPCLHRRHVEIHRLEIGDREERKRRELGDVDGLQVAAAAAADLEAAVGAIGAAGAA